MYTKTEPFESVLICMRGTFLVFCSIEAPTLEESAEASPAVVVTATIVVVVVDSGTVALMVVTDEDKEE